MNAMEIEAYSLLGVALSYAKAYEQWAEYWTQYRAAHPEEEDEPGAFYEDAQAQALRARRDGCQAKLLEYAQGIPARSRDRRAAGP